MSPSKALLFASLLVSPFAGCAQSSSQSSAGSGGNSASGGSNSSGGNNNSGGSTGTGGKTASGGSSGSGSGGSTSQGSGGATQSGGSKGSGGTTGTAGTSGSGGATGSGGSSAKGGSGGSGSGGSTSSGGSTGSGGSTSNAVVQVTQTQQLIDGFGISNAWTTEPTDATVKAKVLDALFSVTKGAGLSILRNRIPFRENSKYDDKFINKNSDGTYISTTNSDGSKTFSLNWSSWDLSGTAALITDLQASTDYQVTQFMSTPWTPPNNSVSMWKQSDSNKTIDYVNAPEVGGELKTQYYADYADVLADYVLGYKAKMGVDLNVLSLQNEPNYQCSYESADWSAAQFHDFFVVLNTEFTKKGVFTSLPNLKIMAPEYQNVKEDLVLPTLADSSTASLLGLVGVHQYEFGTGNVNTYTPPKLTTSLAAGKRVWMTEFSTAAWGTDNTITDGLILARLIHMDMTAAQMSAFNYWWVWGSGQGHLVLLSGTDVTSPKRLWTMANFSRFIRPGWSRVTTNTAPATNVLLSAYKDSTGSQVAVVAINTGTSSATFPLTLDSGQFGTITQYRTSATEDLANVGTLTGGSSVSVTLPASSVTTFVAPLQ